MVVLKDSINKIKKYSVVKSWLSNLSYRTQINYLSALAEFCMVNHLNPQEMLETIHQEEEERLPAWNKAINKWFEKYDQYCIEQNRSLNTRNTRRIIVNGFISYHELPTYSSNKRKRKFKGLKEPNKRDGLTKQDVRDLISVAKSWKMKAIILAQLSSGLTSIDLLNLTLKDFYDGIIEVFDNKTKCIKRICQLKLVRQKTDKEYTTFFSEEAVSIIEKYLLIERNNPQPEDALFTGSREGKTPLNTVSLQQAYRNLNDYLGWEQKEIGRFRKATSHMMRKFFNTQLINAGMPEEIREHFMGHQYKDKVRDAYFLANPNKLREVYVKYMEELTIGIEKPPVSRREFLQLKNEYDFMQSENDKLKLELENIQLTLQNYELLAEDVDKEIKKENSELRNALSGLVMENEVQKGQLSELSDILRSMRKELKELKSNV